MSVTVTRPPIDCLVGQYARHVKGLPFSPATVRAYVHGVSSYMIWLASQDKHDYLEVVTDPMTATFAGRDYKRYLLTVRKLAPKSVDSQLTAIGSMYQWLGMDRPDVPLSATRSVMEDPKSLDEDQLRDVLRAAERRGVRDHALVMLLYASGARVAEAAALDADDVRVSERLGQVKIRSGKGGSPRNVPINDFPGACHALNRWFRVRQDQHGLGRDSGPLFVRSSGERLAIRSYNYVVQKVGEKANVELSPHTLRHTFARTMIDAGVDVTTVGELLGHRTLATTMVYTRPRAAHREAAAASLAIDY